MAIIATAAWAVPKAVASAFPSEGSVLARYAAVFRGVEINSTFYRSHRETTYARWAETTGPDFRFAVKVPKAITHDRRLSGIGDLFRAFVDEIAPLGGKIGPLLCQLPPSLAFDPKETAAALGAIRRLWDGPLVIEPRHRSFADKAALDLLAGLHIGRVLADPAPVWPPECFAAPVAYLRLHGRPRLYYSRYESEALARYHTLLGPESWCVFDNTAEGAATANALEMLALG